MIGTGTGVGRCGGGLAWVAVIALLAIGCTDPPQICTKTKAMFFECTKDAPAHAISEIYRTCVKVVPTADRSDEGRATKAMFEDCASARTCADFAGCFERHGCQLIVTGPHDKVLKLMCALPSTHE